LIPHRIIGVTLDSKSLTTRAADIEVEKHRAVSDLLHENSFRLKTPETAEGPYNLTLSLQEGRLVIDVGCVRTGHREGLQLALAPLRKHISDYVIICDNFYKTARAGQIHRLEAIDAGRRAVHDEGAGLLAEALEDKVLLDKPTARRLFSLVYVLHMRGINH